MVKRLLDKVVVITGATSGIGLEIAKFSISQGAEVVISGRSCLLYTSDAADE